MAEKFDEFSESTELFNKSTKLECSQNKEATNDAETDKAKNSFKFWGISRRKKAILILCIMGRFLAACSASLIVPFYPKEAEKKGMDLTMIGFVFGVNQLVIFVSSPFIGNFITRIGVKFVLLSGVFLAGCSTILFGTLTKGPDGVSFAVMCVLCRAMEALGFAGFINASLTCLSNEFPENIGTVVSLMNSALGLGFMVGSPIGGALYELQGFGVPFYSTGVCVLINGICLFTLLPKMQDVAHKRKDSMFKLLHNHMIVIPLLSTFVGYAGISLMDASFAELVEPFNLSAGIVGSLFVMGSASYSLVSPVYGYLSDAKNIPEQLIIFGHLVLGLGFLVAGPSPLLPFIPFELSMSTLGNVLCSISLPGILVTTLKLMIEGAHRLEYEKNVDTCALVTGLYSSVLALGGFVGPFAGGAIIQSYGFPKGFTLFGMLNLFMIWVFCIYSFIRYLKRRNKHCDARDSESDMKSHSTEIRETQ